MDDYFQKIYKDMAELETVRDELGDALDLMERFEVIKEYIKTKGEYDQIQSKLINCISYLPK